ncbi:cell envelope biogenesis protein OmpA [Kitasatospora sp. NPDC006697]|uniref:cell envelope biogenesis protein OmpA n=1 Tax=unclassified Kitasatospora TaxID=2633591 RepID=UPI0036A42E16
MPSTTSTVPEASTQHVASPLCPALGGRAVQAAGPPVPIRCRERQLVGGLVVPWISYEHGGHSAFGTVDAVRAQQALAERLCQVCGEQLEERFCLAVRPMDVRVGFAPEPALHPECLAYSKQRCPMLNGTATTYRASSMLARHPAGRPCDDLNCPCLEAVPDEGHSARSGRPADDFDAWMIDTSHYRIKTAPDRPHVLLGVDLAVPVLRIRPIRRNPQPELDRLLALFSALGL